MLSLAVGGALANSQQANSQQANSRQAVHRAPSPQGQDGETDPSHDGQDHGGAIDAYLQRTEPLFERSFAAARRCRHREREGAKLREHERLAQPSPGENWE